MNIPIKRHIALQPISREHHYGLLLSWKIREGFKRDTSIERVKAYTDWFWKSHLVSHIKFEEQHIYPILGKEHSLIKRARREHARLKKLFTAKDRIELNLSLIEEELTAHIRFEERKLFQEIQKVASKSQLELIESTHSKKETIDEWHDEFWL